MSAPELHENYNGDFQVVLSERLVVSRHVVPSTDACEMRWVFLARLRYADQPEVIAHATYNPQTRFLDWIEVNSRFRRQGFGREFYHAVDQQLEEPIDSVGGSEDAVPFFKALELEHLLDD